MSYSSSPSATDSQDISLPVKPESSRAKRQRLKDAFISGTPDPAPPRAPPREPPRAKSMLPDTESGMVFSKPPNPVKFNDREIHDLHRRFLSPVPEDGGLAGGPRIFSQGPEFNQGERFSQGLSEPERFERGFSAAHGGGAIYERGVRYMSRGDVDQLWLEAVHKKDAYGTAFNTAMAGDVFEINGGDLIAARVEIVPQRPQDETIGEEIDSVTPVIEKARPFCILFNERGQKMTWQMYYNRWTEIAQLVAIDSSNVNMLVCEYVQITHDGSVDDFFEFAEMEMAHFRLIKTTVTMAERRLAEGTDFAGKDTNKNDPTLLVQMNLADIIKKIEGFYVMKSRPIGDLTEPLFAGYAGMLWTVRGYRRLTARVMAELSQFESLLDDWFRDRPLSIYKLSGSAGPMGPLTLTMVLSKKNLITPLAMLLDTMLVFRYTSHQQVYDKNAMERISRTYENQCHAMMQHIERIFYV